MVGVRPSRRHVVRLTERPEYSLYCFPALRRHLERLPHVSSGLLRSLHKRSSLDVPDAALQGGILLLLVRSNDPLEGSLANALPPFHLAKVADGNGRLATRTWVQHPAEEPGDTDPAAALEGMAPAATGDARTERPDIRESLDPSLVLGVLGNLRGLRILARNRDLDQNPGC